MPQLVTRGVEVLWEIAGAVWDWATDNRRRAIRFFSTVGVLVLAAGVAVLVVSTRPVQPESLCDSVSDLETDLAVSFGTSTGNAVFDGLAEVAGGSERLADDAPGDVGTVHASAAGLRSLADRDSISMAEVLSALQPVQAYCANLAVAAQAAAVAPPGGESYVEVEQAPASTRPTAPPTRPVTPSTRPSSSAPSSSWSSSPSSTPIGSSSSGTGPSEDEALLRLAAARADSLQDLVLDQRWVAQVASKSVGITDPLQTAQNGTHTFYAADILAESEAASSVARGAPVLVLTSADFGKRSYAADGEPYWVTLVDAGFTNSEDVELWCARAYPTLTAEQVANACAARTLAPPHG